MFINNVKGLIVFTFAVLIINSASASPHLNRNTSDSYSQTKLIEEAYRILLKNKEKKPSLQKAVFTPTTKKSYNRRLRVTATAYTSHVAQTDSTPNIAAWGDRLRPGMKAIAVSRDLLNIYGLKHKQKVRIKGLEGEYVVLDKMNKRWRKKIDIYMGMNKRKAFKWGRRKVEILWN